MGKKTVNVLNVKRKILWSFSWKGAEKEERIFCECCIMLENNRLFGKVINLELFTYMY